MYINNCVLRNSTSISNVIQTDTHKTVREQQFSAVLRVCSPPFFVGFYYKGHGCVFC